MAYTMRVGAALAILIMGGSALQMAVDEKICDRGQTPYEAMNLNYPGVCSVFCVPEGECLGQAQAGKLKYLGINGEGNCKRKGYTEPEPLGNLTLKTAKFLKALQGPCKGMTLSKFQRPAVAEQKMFVDDRICKKEYKPFEAIDKKFPGVCSVFCVPEGPCEGQAQMGQLKYLGITGEGNCKGRGYTEAGKLGNLTRGTVQYLKNLQGPCKGMTLNKFQKPIEAKQKMFVDDRICEKYHTAYEMTTPLYPGVCTVFCVPGGECLGQAQTGKLNYLGITGEGNCKGKGYTESASLGNVTLRTQKYLASLQGPCKGITLSKFEKPKTDGKKVFERICGEYQTPFKMTTPLYPGACTVFCVPGGECLGQAQTGKLNYLGITGEGNCHGDGYTVPAKLGNVTLKTQKWLEALQGPCKGMTLAKFQKPGM